MQVGSPHDTVMCCMSATCISFSILSNLKWLKKSHRMRDYGFIA